MPAEVAERTQSIELYERYIRGQGPAGAGVDS